MTKASAKWNFAGNKGRRFLRQAQDDESQREMEFRGEKGTAVPSVGSGQASTAATDRTVARAFQDIMHTLPHPFRGILKGCRSYSPGLAHQRLPWVWGNRLPTLKGLERDCPPDCIDSTLTGLGLVKDTQGRPWRANPGLYACNPFRVAGRRRSIFFSCA